MRERKRQLKQTWGGQQKGGWGWSERERQTASVCCIYMFACDTFIEVSNTCGCCVSPTLPHT